MRSLIVNADDFGFTPGINQAVMALHRAGALTSATLMAAAPSFAEAVELARLHPTLGVGCHIVLVDGRPLSPPETISTLLDAESSEPAFRPTLGRFVRDLLRGRIDPQHIETEAAAQMQRLQASGLDVTHCDTHKHTHMFPRVLAPVLRAAQQCGVRRIRNPFEPAWSVKATSQADWIRRMEVRILGALRQQFLEKVRDHAMVTTAGCLGVLATGTLDAATLLAILDKMPEGTSEDIWELVCHPAYVDEELRAARTRLQDSRSVEVEALLATLALNSGRHTEIAKIHYGDLT
ncbi:MAG TPA: ChbG/HpnK family deacetylase [Acidobacteriaceae bacterium]|nr:ChbG/HpnK family deacetylase [Acidobacteriaceae bacterium]